MPGGRTVPRASDPGGLANPGAAGTVPGVVTEIHVPRGLAPQRCRCGHTGDLDTHLQECLETGTPLVDYPADLRSGDPVLREAAAAVLARGWDTLAGILVTLGDEPSPVRVVSDRHGLTVVGDPDRGTVAGILTAAGGVDLRDGDRVVVPALTRTGPAPGTPAG